MPRAILTLIILFVLAGACRNRKVNLASDESVEISEFISSFPKRPLPLLLSDTGLIRPSPDSMLISPKILKEFVPDSVYNAEFGKGSKPRFHMLGMAEVKDAETYLFLKVSDKSKAAAYVLSFDQNLNFKASMPLIYPIKDRNLVFEAGMDRRYAISRTRWRKQAGLPQTYRKNVFVYNNAGLFSLILTESNEQVEDREVYNPIDTLPSRHKLSADYVANRKNFVSIRDGQTPGRAQFFIHFEKDNGECTGEIRGEADLVKPNVMLYRRADDHCQLEFTFTAQSVQISELEACGNHRGIKCSFEGSYPRKKPKSTAATKPAKKKKG